MSYVPNLSSGKIKAQTNLHSDKHSVVFFGCELPKQVTKNEILLFLHEYRQSVTSIQVVFSKKWGNFAKITFVTSAAAQAAIKHYSGLYWHEFGVCVTLKPWEEMKESYVVRHKQEYRDEGLSAHDTNNMADSHKIPMLQCTLSDKRQSESTTGHPMLSSTTQTNNSAILTDLRFTNYKNSNCNSKVYTIKVCGLTLNVEKQQLEALVIPFGDLTSPVKINRYPNNGICYAYVNYHDQHSAIAAVSKLDGYEFNGIKIHVCHKGHLQVYHNCDSEHRALNASQRLKCGSTTVAPSNRDARKFQSDRALIQ